MCKVIHANGRPILLLPDRETQRRIPSGTVDVSIDERLYEADFVKIAVNALREKDRDENVLPTILRGWFGPDAGRPGTAFTVAFEPTATGYRLAPLGRRSVLDRAELWRSYSREQIPGLFGLEFRSAVWRQTGFVVQGNDVFLLVTLEKGTHPEAHRYEDRFLTPDLFQWESQNRTTQQGKPGQLLLHHVERGVRVHLFVRKDSKIAGRAAPFIFCGTVTFLDWENEKPITVRWKLPESVPQHLRPMFGLASEVPAGAG